MLDTPVLFIIFNRPNCTKAVFAQIRNAKPKQLFIAADGPRITKPDEDLLCNQTRKIVADIDWECEVKELFSEENMGCGRAVSRAINWFFDNVDMGIILEDDCVPNQSFFTFCEVLLMRFRNDFRVWQISGSNLISELSTNELDSYFFSYYGTIWGWATWKDRWKNYDFKIEQYTQLKEKTDYFYNLYGSQEQAQFRVKIYDSIVEKKIDTWDYQWSFIKNINRGLSIIPSKNLISNIGFGEDSTHTYLIDDIRRNLSRNELNFPLNHPQKMIRDKEKDDYYFRMYCQSLDSGRFHRYISRLIKLYTK
jgi:hypothetical protein